jgi:hypothetical protein
MILISSFVKGWIFYFMEALVTTKYNERVLENGKPCLTITDKYINYYKSDICICFIVQKKPHFLALKTRL